MVSNIAVADAVLKVGYEDIHDQLEYSIPALQLVERGAKHITDTNVKVEFAARMGRSAGIGARNEGEILPTAGNAKDARAEMFLKTQYGRVQGTHHVFAQVKEKTASFVDWMQREMTDVIESLKRDINRQVYGDGTGTLAVLASGATAATTITVDSVHWLEEDMLVDVLTVGTLSNPVPTSGIVQGTIARIVSIDPSTNVVTLADAAGGSLEITAATGSAVVRGDYNESSRQNNWNREWEGLGLIVDNGTLHGINPSTFPKWLPAYQEGTIGTLQELDPTKLVTAANRKGGKITDFLTTPGVTYAYWAALQGLRRFQGNGTLEGGATKPTFDSIYGSVPITIDHFCPPGTLYGINKGELYIHELGDWKWEDRTGSIWVQVPERHAFRATVYKMSNMGTFRRNTHGKLTGITEVGV